MIMISFHLWCRADLQNAKNKDCAVGRMVSSGWNINLKQIVIGIVSNCFQEHISQRAE